MENRTRRIHIDDPSKFVSLGRTGENEFRAVEIDVSGWFSEDAEYRIVYSRPDGITYPVAAKRSGDIFLWELKAYDVEVAGFGKFEVRAYIGDTIGKSAIFKVNIENSIQTDETVPGTVRPDWVDDIIDKIVIDKVEQTTTSTEDGGTNIVTVTLTNGDTSTFEVRNGTKGNRGEKGDIGQKGDDGYTPQKGIDYWTEEDKSEIVGMVDAYTKEETMTKIEVFVSNELDVLYRTFDPHIADTDNPHNVTAEQVDTYTKGEIDVFVSDLGDVSARVSDLEAKLGDIKTALDAILAHQRSYTGGDI